VKALGQLLSFLADEPEVEVFASLIPPILQVASQQASDEDLVLTVLNFLYDFAYSPSQAVTVHLIPMVQFALECVKSQNLEMGVRDSAALVIATLAEAKPFSLQRRNGFLDLPLDDQKYPIEPPRRWRSSSSDFPSSSSIFKTSSSKLSATSPALSLSV
jgi:hypothetical protein